MKSEKNKLFLSLLVVLVIYLYKTPLIEYEISIYKATPVAWFLLTLISIYYITFTTGKKEDLLILIIIRIIVLYIPYIRGYFSWDFDHLVHLRMIKNILDNGHIIDRDNIYPLLHIYLGIFNYITDLRINLIANYFTGIISTLYLSFILLIYKEIDRKNYFSILILSPIIFNTMDVFLTPNGTSVLISPIYYYSIIKYFKNNKIEYAIISIIFSISILYYHILTFLIITFSTVIIYIYFLYKNKSNLNLINFIIVLFSLLIIYIIYTPQIYHLIRNFVLSIYSVTYQSPIDKANIKLNSINLVGFNLLRFIMFKFGEEVLFYIMTLLYLLIDIKKILSKKIYESYIIYSVFNIAILLTFIISIFGYMGNLSQIPERLLRYPILFTPIYVISLFHKNNIWKKRVKVLLIFCIIFSTYGLFPSEYVSRHNYLITRSNVFGIEYYIRNKNNYTITAYVYDTPKRIIQYINYNEYLERNDVKKFILYNDHFNITNLPLKGQKHYLYYTKSDTMIYNTVYKTIGRFNQKDFYNLYQTIEYIRIYDNKGMFIYDYL